MSKPLILPEDPKRNKFLERVKEERKRARKESLGMSQAEAEGKEEKVPSKQLVLYSGPVSQSRSKSLPKPVQGKKCKFPDDIETVLNKYKLNCDKGDYKRISLLVHPDRNPPECKEDADKLFATLNSLKMKCEERDPNCKYRSVGSNISEIVDNHKDLENMHPDSLMRSLIRSYGENCHGKLFEFLDRHLIPEENKNCEAEAFGHKIDLDFAFKFCNPSSQPSSKSSLSWPSPQPSPQRRKPSPQPSPQRRKPSPQRRKPSPQRRRPSPQRRKPSPQRRKPSPQRRRPSPQRSKSPTVASLRAEAKKLGCRGYSKLTKVELLKFIKKCKKGSPKSNMTVTQLKAQAKKLGCRGYSRLNKVELIKFIKKC